MGRHSRVSPAVPSAEASVPRPCHGLPEGRPGGSGGVPGCSSASPPTVLSPLNTSPEGRVRPAAVPAGRPWTATHLLLSQGCYLESSSVVWG